MLKFPLVITLASLLMAGCQTAPQSDALTPEQAQANAQQRLRFEALMSNVLRKAAGRNNTQDLSGSFNLVMRVDRDNQVVGCATQPNKKIDPKQYPYNPTLAAELRSICWTQVLPPVPASLFNPDEKIVTVVAPVVVYPLGGLNAEQRNARSAILQRTTQNDFLYTRLIAPQPVDSIGVATVVLMSDSSGHVKECAASLGPHTLRPQAFKQDDALLGSLITRCKQLNISAMPGFVANADGMTSVVNRIEYTPWKAGLEPTKKHVTR